MDQGLKQSDNFVNTPKWEKQAQNQSHRHLQGQLKNLLHQSLKPEAPQMIGDQDLRINKSRVMAKSTLKPKPKPASKPHGGGLSTHGSPNDAGSRPKK
ncbi:MAG: hypothetical protein ACOCXD_00655 [Bacteroidota bacterium]